MSVFTSHVTKTIQVPHDPDQSITIRKLAPRHLEQAAKAQQIKAMEDLRAMGGAAFMKELQTLRDANPDTDAAIADPMNRFDHLVLMEKGVVGWTYQEKQPTREAYEDLDDATSDFIARAILKLSKPSLFESKEEAEADRKNV